MKTITNTTTLQYQDKDGKVYRGQHFSEVKIPERPAARRQSKPTAKLRLFGLN